MTTYHFADVMPDGCVRACLPGEGEDDGSLFVPEVEGIAVMLDGPINWRGPTPTAVLYWECELGLHWKEGATAADLPAIREQAIDAIDTAGEALRMAVISRMTQTPEYVRAEQHAREYRAAGYPEGEDAYVPPGVASWAMAKWRQAWTARQAADDILATADRWYALLDEIRALRLANKEDARHATTAGEVAAIVADMQADMQALALQMNTITTTTE